MICNQGHLLLGILRPIIIFLIIPDHAYDCKVYFTIFLTNIFSDHFLSRIAKNTRKWNAPTQFPSDYFFSASAELVLDD